MISRNMLMMTTAAALTLAPVSRAMADNSGALVGLIGGALVGAAIANSANKNKRVVVRTGVSTTRAANIETQTALNYFGYNAGTPDGVLGRNSRTAISGYQAYMAFPITGTLTQFERDILVGAYNRGIAGGAETLQLVSRSADGTKALLLQQRDIMTGGTAGTRRTVGYAGLPIEVSDAVDEIANSSDPTPEQLLARAGFIQLADLNGDGNNDYILDTSFSGSSFWCNTVQCKSIVFVSTAEGYRRNDLLAANPTPATFTCVGGSCTVNSGVVMASSEAPAVTVQPAAPVTTLASTGTLPTFGAVSTGPSLAGACAGSGALGSGLVMASNDARALLQGHFCDARADAMADSDSMVSGLAGVTMAQVDAQCGQYGDALSAHVASLSLKPRSDVVSDVAGFANGSGIDSAQLASTAKICLGAGYRLDDMEIAIGSGLLLVALGEAPYGELLGHHLALGFGAKTRPDLAAAWYQDALDSVAAGTPAVFGPFQSDRPEAVQAAVNMLTGTEPATTVLAPISSSAKMPTLAAPKKKSR